MLHVVGKGNLDPQFADRPAYRQLDYLHDMPHALALAGLVIGRAGSTALAELDALELPAVLVPLPASVSPGDQLDNARLRRSAPGALPRRRRRAADRHRRTRPGMRCPVRRPPRRTGRPSGTGSRSRARR
ncbi:MULTISPECIES: glycosyltransferase [unclassified Streptomyces]|uniref:glycosyltransferase n=1 Tax=Streptomyces sp. NPDC127532 TaxID=3345399 RepID=UPI003639676A